MLSNHSFIPSPKKNDSYGSDSEILNKKRKQLKTNYASDSNSFPKMKNWKRKKRRHLSLIPENPDIQPKIVEPVWPDEPVIEELESIHEEEVFVEEKPIWQHETIMQHTPIFEIQPPDFIIEPDDSDYEFDKYEEEIKSLKEVEDEIYYILNDRPISKYDTFGFKKPNPYKTFIEMAHLPAKGRKQSSDHSISPVSTLDLNTREYGSHLLQAQKKKKSLPMPIESDLLSTRPNSEAFSKESSVSRDASLSDTPIIPSLVMDNDNMPSGSRTGLSYTTDATMTEKTLTLPTKDKNFHSHSPYSPSAQPKLSQSSNADLKYQSIPSFESLIPDKEKQLSLIQIEEFLNEKPVKQSKKAKEKDLLHKFAEAANLDAPEFVQSNTKKGKWWTHLFRLINFVRALGTTSYGIYLIVVEWNNPVYYNLGAKNFFYASLAFLCLDLLITFVKAFPKFLWCFWDVKKWDPFSRTFSIWNLVADHELLLDMSPVLANVILKVYGYRLGEIVSSDSAVVDQQPLSRFGLDWSAKTLNFVMLLIFSITLFMTVLLHFIRLSKSLIRQKSAYLLVVILLIKLILLLFDLLTNSFLLYQVLVFQQESIFQLTFIVNLVLAVFSASPFIGLTTNVLVNLPLHITHLKMQLKGRQLTTGERGESVLFSRIFKSALKKTFHPLIMSIFGTYAIFSVFALGFILVKIYQFDYNALLRIPATIPFQFNQFQGDSSVWNDPTFRQDVLLVLIWLNLVVNYLIGVVCGACYWVMQLLTMFGSIWCIRECLKSRSRK